VRQGSGRRAGGRGVALLMKNLFASSVSRFRQALCDRRPLMTRRLRIQRHNPKKTRLRIVVRGQSGSRLSAPRGMLALVRASTAGEKTRSPEALGSFGRKLGRKASEVPTATTRRRVAAGP